MLAVLHQHIRLVFKDAINYKELIQDLLDWNEKQLYIGVVGSSNKVDYKQGFELAKSYINESPCDPDIYKEQLAAWDKYQLWLRNNKLT